MAFPPLPVDGATPWGTTLRNWAAAVEAALEARGLIITAVDVPTIPAGDTTDNLAAYYNSAAAPIAVAGVELAAGSHAVWVWVADAWALLSSGTSTPPVDPSDTTAPVWSATLTTGTPTDTAVVIAASALAADNVAVTGYRWRLTGEDAGVARTITPSGLNFTLDGLTASASYAAPIFWAVDAGGNKSAELTAQGFTTDEPPAGWVVVIQDSLTDADGTLLTAHTPEVGSWGAESTAKIYGNKMRRQNVADETACGARKKLSGAVTRARLTADFDNAGAAPSNPGIRLGFMATGTGSAWVDILQNGTITAWSWNGHTFTETSGNTAAAPTAGTAEVEIDYLASTMNLRINGATVRAWGIVFSGSIGVIDTPMVDVGRFIEDTAPSSIDNLKCEVWP